jgi:hypothetical protein
MSTERFDWSPVPAGRGAPCLELFANGRIPKKEDFHGFCVRMQPISGHTFFENARRLAPDVPEKTTQTWPFKVGKQRFARFDETTSREAEGWHLSKSSQFRHLIVTISTHYV